MRRLWPLTRDYGFDALILAGLGIGIAAAVADRHNHDGPQGPIWFDVLVVIGFTAPLLARRRFPVGALLTVGIVIAASTFVDHRLVSDDFIAYLVGLTVSVLFGMRPSRVQSLAGLAIHDRRSGDRRLQRPGSSGGLRLGRDHVLRRVDRRVRARRHVS